MSRPFRFASHTLLFDSEELTVKAIENIAPFVERVYVAYSRRPWAYNAEARTEYQNSASPERLRGSKYSSKIEIVEGDWLTEEAQRNECADCAQRDGFDYLIVQDGDEFYLPSEIEKNLDGIRAEPDFYYYKNPWYLFWKSVNYVLVNRLVVTYRDGRPVTRERDTIHTYSMAFALNLRRNARFASKRKPVELDDYLILPGLAHHLSWVYSDDQMLRKLFTWGHTNDVYDRMLWYRTKWLGWRPSVHNLHPINPFIFARAARFEGELPAEIADFNPGVQRFVAASLPDVLQVKAHELFRRILGPMQQTRRSLRSLSRLRRSDGQLMSPSR